MFNLSKSIVSLFGIGFFPKIPGTIGTFFSILVFYLIFDFISYFYLMLLFILIFLISLKLINIYSKITKSHDSSEIVIDEFLGINFILIFYEYYKFSNEIIMFSLIFIIFRFLL